MLGMGCVGPVPIDKVWEWCDRNGVDEETSDFFCDVIMAVDADTLRRQRKA